jgi:putative ABC transport system permease protein
MCRACPSQRWGRMISVPDDHQPQLSRLHLRKGRWVAPGRDDEVMLSEAFANVHGLGPGDRIKAVVSGRLQEFEIVGVALSAEYIYSISSSNPWPDDKRFGVMWLSREAMGAAFDMEGAFDDVVLTLEPGANEPAVLDAIDRIIEPYGGRGSFGRDKQTSYRFVGEELKQLETMGAVMPTIFLGVAAFLLNVVMSRMIGGQREQIAALKALGYGNLTVGIHYVKLVAVVAIVGTGLGALVAGVLGQGMVGMYHQFFRFPSLVYRTDASVLLTATALSLGAGIVGTFRAVRNAVSLPPAEAMRPPAPARFNKGILERIGLGAILGPSGRIVLRNISRRPLRMLSSTFGIALAMAIMISGNFSQDALKYIMHVNFEVIQREDLTVMFAKSLPSRAVEELEHLEGVVYAEPSRDVPVRLFNGHRSYETAILGLPKDARLRRILDQDLNPVPLPEEGILMTRELGKRLGLVDRGRGGGGGPRRRAADSGRQGRRFRRRDVRDAGLHGDPRRSNPARRGGPSDRSTATPRPDPARRGLPRDQGPAVRGRGDHANRRVRAVNETTAEMQLVTSMILLAFASVVAVGVVYNSARVVLAERSRELASLRVLGFTRAEISSILLGELAVQILLSIPLGCLLGYGMAAGAIAGVDTELFRFPLIIYPRTYALAAGTILVVGTATSLIVRRKLDHLDLVEVLKTRE